MIRFLTIKGTITKSLAPALVLGALFGSHAFAATEDSASCTSLRATGNPEYPPFLWQVENSSLLHGAVANLMSELSKKIQIPIETVYVGPWSRSQQEVRSGRVDLMAGAFYTSERADYMEYFSPAMMFTKSVVWQSAVAKFHYSSWPDLKGRWGVTVINNSFGQKFDNYAKNNLFIDTVPSLEQAFKMLALDRVDYVLYEKNPGLAYASKLGLSHQVSELTPAISSEGLYLTISHNSKCNTGKLRGELAKHLRAMNDEGYTQKALQKSQKLWDEIASH